MYVPWSAIGAAAAIAIVLVAITIVSIFAWFGIARQHQELLARVKVMQIDIFDLKTPMRRIEDA